MAQRYVHFPWVTWNCFFLHCKPAHLPFETGGEVSEKLILTKCHRTNCVESQSLDEVHSFHIFFQYDKGEWRTQVESRSSVRWPWHGRFPGSPGRLSAIPRCFTAGAGIQKKESKRESTWGYSPVLLEENSWKRNPRSQGIKFPLQERCSAATIPC